MTSEESKILAIIRRNAQGQLERVTSQAKVTKGDKITILPIKGGSIVIIGSLHENDETILNNLLKDLSDTS